MKIINMNIFGLVTTIQDGYLKIDGEKINIGKVLKISNSSGKIVSCKKRDLFPHFFEIAANPRANIEMLKDIGGDIDKKLIKMGKSFVKQSLNGKIKEMGEAGCNTVYVLRRENDIAPIVLSADEDGFIGKCIYKEVALVGVE